ncbi:efflux RND transporter periplasmic adaptor subunit [Dichotomicrobium thermohalophilum]|uniref:Membrane fusion protein (Multidrug efflux system) n=1 Tax=Dichotomicrobium thermohalophilum TaxID=933063 RepID=A0A397Q889_9HYPH|nr:efflux RND transporter periplasmic adaptor subunit [Dichotomicrobium thermohalophilum]RIA55737.1 membrane fusion protein (multidrug efflux system) [Dichotomicrobium thermohalophilum]
MLSGSFGRLPVSVLTAFFISFAFVLGAPGARAQNAVPVEATTVESGAVRDEVEVVGNILADETVVIRPEISGLVKEIHFSEGDTVEDGDLLFSLDDEILTAEVAEAKAAHELAKRNFERSKQLYSRKVGTERTRDEALAEMQSSEAKLALAKARLNKTKIRAPFSGIVGFREISVGAYVSAGTDLVRLVKTDPVEVSFRVPERFLGVLRRGQKITVRVDAFPDRGFSGEVFALDNVVDVNGRSIQVRARVPNPDLLLRPGLFARVNLVTELRQDAVIVPEAAIVPTVEGAYVYRVVDGKAKRTEVTVGRRMAGEVEIVDGLSAGETVIVAGQQKVRDGAPVQPVGSAQGA